MSWYNNSITEFDAEDCATCSATSHSLDEKAA